MTIISYAQNCEDVMLWRALGHLDKGFYIDVGANDPAMDSVTKLFYDRGWRGINVEPINENYIQLCCDRVEDINIKKAVAEKIGILPYFEIPQTGLSTLDATIAAQHKDKGRTVIEQIIEVTTLTDICNTHVQADIHFLKIDVEGAEADVVRGMDFKKFRPWIILLEATLPGTTQVNYAEWEPLLLEQQYEFVYFDGLNRFYLASEHLDLAHHFSSPPNCFDRYRKNQEVELELQNKVLRKNLRAQYKRLVRLERDKLCLKEQLSFKKKMIEKILPSRLWFILLPIEKVKNIFKLLKTNWVNT